MKGDERWDENRSFAGPFLDGGGTHLFCGSHRGGSANLEAMLRQADIPAPYVFAPESFGSLVVIAFANKHPEEVAGWPSSQDRLAQLSQAGVVVVATEADHQITQDEPELAARTVLRVVEQVGAGHPFDSRPRNEYMHIPSENWICGYTPPNLGS